MSSAGVNTRLKKFNPLRSILGNAFGYNLAMDLGTANTLIYIKGKGVVLNEPSLVAMEDSSNKAVAVGQAAKDMFGRTPSSIKCIRPLKDGVIADFNVASIMIKHMINKVTKKRFLAKPRLIVSVPSSITQVEKRAVIQAAYLSGVYEVRLVEEPMAAALGLGLPVDKSPANMLINIGGGTTEIAIIRSSETVYSNSIRVAGDVMDEAIQLCIKRKFDLQIGILEAERIKIAIGSALPSTQKSTTPVFGRDLIRCLPQKIEVADDLIRTALNESITTIISSIITALEQTDLKVAQDIIERGVYLAGGGALLSGLPERLSREAGVAFHLAQDPTKAVIHGVGHVADNLKENHIYCVA
ncbi:MAG: rod shape-determining protein [Bdellovibrionota bacterium]|jgi:rod shape-determining protein MreB